jgi:hypothetical protein
VISAIDALRDSLGRLEVDGVPAGAAASVTAGVAIAAFGVPSI